MNRRSFLLSTATGLLYGSSGVRAFAQETAAEEAADAAPHGAPFSFDLLSKAMKERAAQAYEPPQEELPEAIAELTYDQHRAIRYRPDHAVWRGEAPFELQAFHMGWLFKAPVHIHAVKDGRAEPVTFHPRDFEYREPLDPEQFDGMTMPGVAGFRLHCALNSPGVMDELAAFLGASYFRVLGRGNLYGLSARGLAVNTATSQGEEFPRFTDFYIETPDRRDKEITVHAALDSESVTGAYSFVIAPGQNTVMDVTLRLFVRRDIQRLGIAPMTSMFLFAENNRSAFDDYRGQVHDSDGLKIVRQNGDELWRNLNNPKELANSFFAEENPRAFGLYQRDRDYENYQDAGAGYERRPSLLVEPLGTWGKGWINLVEIPTELEINDNIVAFWVPEGEIKAGQELEFRYRLSWGAIEEPSTHLARVTALRTGEGGVSGVENGGDGTRKFVVDFDGKVLRNLPEDSDIKANVNVRNADIVHSTVSRVAATGAWRLVIDLKPANNHIIELNAHLAKDGEKLSETWLYQWRVGDEKQS